ncbi:MULTISPECIES: hypothetical protein [Bradyrhizobium]|uniref:hypothetical protein n=1 Tax=Bradyrhizobium elkanii TaxID=29448 RepID=UPI002714AD19|nr:hypothetical protein [Bradyrhizobium elkanii]WLA48593.1 hypothetical protein QIH80_44845 [Bradyrhizobium elkanii]WLB81200.1 hypothetical protein QIH83_00615 [Bradyrhizobium elkanii]
MADHLVQPGMIEIAIEPRSKADHQRLEAALADASQRGSFSAISASVQQLSGGLGSVSAAAAIAGVLKFQASADVFSQSQTCRHAQ